MTHVVVGHAVNMTDVDSVQVNFSRFFVWMDDGYMTLLRECGHPLSGIIASGWATPVVEVRCNYRRPVSLDAEFTVTSATVSVGESSFLVAHRFEDTHGLFAIGRATHVWIALEPSQSPARAPDWLRNAAEPDFLVGVET